MDDKTNAGQTIENCVNVKCVDSRFFLVQIELVRYSLSSKHHNFYF